MAPPATMPAGRHVDERDTVMCRLSAILMLAVLALAPRAEAQAPPRSAATPSDCILLTVIMRHDQTMNRDEIDRIQAQTLREQALKT